MNRVLWMAVLFSFVGIAGAAGAKDKDDEPFSGFGLTTTSCGVFLEAMEGERKARPPNANPDGIYSEKYGGYLDFLDGFMTGSNYADDPPNRMIGRGSDHAGRMAWIENYCRANPLSPYGSAVIELRRHLEGR
jgi:hypothetical protein